MKEDILHSTVKLSEREILDVCLTSGENKDSKSELFKSDAAAVQDLLSKKADLQESQLCIVNDEQQMEVLADKLRACHITENEKPANAAKAVGEPKKKMHAYDGGRRSNGKLNTADLLKLDEKDRRIAHNESIKKMVCDQYSAQKETNALLQPILSALSEKVSNFKSDSPVQPKILYQSPLKTAFRRMKTPQKQSPMVKEFLLARTPQKTRSPMIDAFNGMRTPRKTPSSMVRRSRVLFDDKAEDDQAVDVTTITEVFEEDVVPDDKILAVGSICPFMKGETWSATDSMDNTGQAVCIVVEENPSFLLHLGGRLCISDNQIDVNSILPRVHSCNLFQLCLVDQSISSDDFEKLVCSNSIKNFAFHRVTVKDEDGYSPKLVDILKELPNIETFEYCFNDGEETARTAKRLLSLSIFPNLRSFSLFNVSSSLCKSRYDEFQAKYPNAKFVFDENTYSL